MNYKINKLSSKDIENFVELLNVFSIVFEINNFVTPDRSHLAILLGKPDFIVFVAKHNNKVVGGLTVFVLHGYYSTRPSAYIYDLGVLPDYQRKGIGKRLIIYLIQHCKENNFEEMYVEAETDDIDSINFYRQTAYSSKLQATHFTFSFPFDKAEFDSNR